MTWVASEGCVRVCLCVFLLHFFRGEWGGGGGFYNSIAATIVPYILTVL